ncbi:MAG: hypothetical protein R2762_07655 [Bryobacteraceae bacterium]
MAVTIDTVSWGGWPNCRRISNGEVELILTADVGPRIIRYGYCGGQNLFLEIPDQLGGAGESGFRPRGGHRLWSAPEQFPRTYYPDNDPVEIEVQGTTLTATAPVETTTGLRKQIRVRMAAVGSAVTVNHGIENTLAWPIEVSAWALTMMAPGGVGISGFPPRGTHPEMLAPTHPLVMWAFSDLSDQRWSFTRKHMILRQDPAIPAPTKLGFFNENTWGAYLLRGELFLKQYHASPGKPYPDMGASFETFANDTTLELETLSPMTMLEPGGKLDHIERWSLARGVQITSWNDDGIEEALGRLL